MNHGSKSFIILLFQMSEEYCQSILRIALAQICQSVGWNAAQSTPLELLTDVMGRYMLQLAKVTHRYAEQCTSVIKK